MLKNKIAIWLLLVCLTFSTLAESDSLLSAENIESETQSHDTYTVEPGTYEKTASTNGTVFYPHTYQLRFDVNDAKFVEYKVKRNDEVKKGDVLAVFSLPGDKVTLATKQLSLDNAIAELESGTLSRQESIDELMEQFASVTDPYERQILSLRVQRAEIALEQYVYQQELKIAELQETVSELEEELTTTTLVAPADGIISELQFKRTGDRISSNEILITLYSTDDLLIEVDNSNGYFRYGMEVTVDVGRPKNRTSLTGHVVGSDEALPESRKNKLVYVALDDYEYDDEIDFLQISVYGVSQSLENVVIIPRRSATLNDGKYYVRKLVDGQIQKRYINYGMQNTSHIWVLQGLDAGETIITD